MQSISLVVITFNEERNIGACIESVSGIATETIVLDSGSTDRTVEIARSLGATVHTHPFDGHIQQKNRAAALASGSWILSLDADERLSPELAASIANAEEVPEISGYIMNRLNHYKGRPVKTCGWYPDRKLRLWRRGKGEWRGQNPHDRFELNEGKTAHLRGDILHFTYADKASMLRQVEKFAGISAEQNAKKPLVVLIFKMLFSGIFKFIRTWIFGLGFTGGRDGWDICIQQSREVFLKYYLAIGQKYHRH